MISDAGHIRRLSPHLVNQIAAGEVIERPASVVKELVENSIDAGALNVRVELEEGGKRLIRITDDGAGIVEEELDLALTSHATSKIREEGDLHEIATLGFRGEALASIASVSELDLLSRPATRDESGCRVARDGNVEPGPPEWISPGTRITVRNLFYNVPARKRFLKSDRAELTRIRNVMREIALGTPAVGFELINDDKTLFRFPSGQEPVRRVAEVLGTEHVDRLLELKPTKLPGRALRGWIGRPDFFRRTSDAIHCFLNGRPVKDKVVLHAAREGYSEFQIPGRYPVAVLFLDLDPAEVDVNVHPAKREVRFRDSSHIHRLVHRAVKERLLEAGCAPDLLSSSSSSRDSGMRTHEPSAGGTPSQWRDARATGAHEFPPIDRSAYGGAFESGGEAAARAESVGETRSESAPADVRSLAEAQELVDGTELRVVQMHNAYLLIEEPDGLRVIDQHALHEKILYEEILEARERDQSCQPLLVPEAVELTDREWEVWADAAKPLAELGFEVEEFGERTVAVRTVPAGFDKMGVATLLRSALERLGAAMDHGGSTDIDLRETLVATLACKRAIKAGQRLTESQLLDLVRGRSRAFHPQNCPHGRAAELFLSWDELDRRFDRK